MSDRGSFKAKAIGWWKHRIIFDGGLKNIKMYKGNNVADFGRTKDPDWTDLDDKDKIERLSAVARSQNILLYQITKYLELLVDHDHMGGQIVQPIDKQFLLQNKRFLCDDLPKNWLN